MIALLQRVSEASVSVEGETIGAIEQGLLVLVGVEKNDTEVEAERLLERVLNYRIFVDRDDKMNLSLYDVQGGLLLVPQFTLTADTKKGARPSFSSAAEPEHSQRLFDYLISRANQYHLDVASGRFGANMQVSLINDGPVTFWLQVSPAL
jgi:D-tyrosyl-tRNA(Tyr) deacylase